MEKETGKRLAGGSGKKQPQEKNRKAKKPKKPSRFTRQQKILIAVAVVLAVVVIAVAACQSLFIRPDIGNKDTSVTDPDTGETQEIDWGEGTRPRSEGERKSEDYYTVLILGRDTGGGGNTDTMLLASYDVTNQKATVMSIPRDTMVNIPYDIKRINAVYNYGGGGDKGIQYLYKEISQLVGFEPDYQVVVEWEAVGEIVDAMGGVWFDVPRNMNYDDPYQDLSIHISKGYQLLDGEQAMGVLRYRHDNDMRYGYPDGDLGRIKTQQAFLQAMVEQLLKLENVTKINQFVEVFQNNVTTDLSLQNIFWFAKAAIQGGLKPEDVTFVTMPNTTAYAYSASTSRLNGRYSEQSYVVPRATQLLELVNTSLSPYVEVFTRSDLDIMTVNSDGSVSSSTGHVEDGNATYPRSYWQAQWVPEEEEAPETDENGDPSVTDPETEEPEAGGEPTDPGTGETTDPDTGDWPLDPETGEPLPPETVYPDGAGGSTDPGTVTDPAAGTETDSDSGTGETAPETDPGFGDGNFTIIAPPPAA